MIDNKCFTTEWIETKAKELNYSDTNLIEKATSLRKSSVRFPCWICLHVRAARSISRAAHA